MKNLAICFSFFFGACGEAVQVGPPVHESMSVPLESAKRAEIEIRMGAGELDIRGGASELIHAQFDYNVAEWKPIVSHTTDGALTRASIHQPKSGKHGNRNVKFQWNVALHDHTPTRLNVDLGAGECRLALGGTQVSDLVVQTGTGALEVDLSGEWKSNLKASIRAGVGETVVRLPKSTGARAQTTRGIGAVEINGLKERNGAYVNEAYGSSPITLEIEVTVGIGRVRLEIER